MLEDSKILNQYITIDFVVQECIEEQGIDQFLIPDCEEEIDKVIDDCEIQEE